MPNTKIVINYVIPGALVVSIFFIAAQYVFIWYVKTFPVYNIVYGSVGALMALLAWVYFSSLILLFGAQATSMFHEYGISQTRPKGFKNFWTGLSKARIRIVETNIEH